MRLIFRSKRQAFDLEWAFVTKAMRDAAAEETEDPEHDSDIMTQTSIAPEHDEIQDSVVPKAHKVIGFKPNTDEKEDYDS